MVSKWADIQPTAIALRKSGLSINAIEAQLGIPRSTLSGWFKHVVMNDTHIARLQKNKEEAWARARVNALKWHRNQKTLRLAEAESDAKQVIERLKLSNDLLDLAFAMLYLGEGAKSGVTSLASSDPMILRFVLVALERIYATPRTSVRCELHLRMDQSGDEMKKYWSEQLGVPLPQFRYVAHDKRSNGKETYKHYKGVCVVLCKNVAIQRKLISLYNLFCDKVTSMDP